MAKKSKIEATAASDPATKKPGGFSGHLRKLIQDSGLSPYEIAQRAGIAPHQIYRFLNEERTLTLETVDKILPIIDENFFLRMMGVDVAKAELSKIRKNSIAYIQQVQDAFEDLKSLLEKGISPDVLE